MLKCNISLQYYTVMMLIMTLSVNLSLPEEILNSWRFHKSSLSWGKFNSAPKLSRVWVLTKPCKRSCVSVRAQPLSYISHDTSGFLINHRCSSELDLSIDPNLGVQKWSRGSCEGNVCSRPQPERLDLSEQLWVQFPACQRATWGSISAPRLCSLMSSAFQLGKQARRQETWFSP